MSSRTEPTATEEAAAPEAAPPAPAGRTPSGCAITIEGVSKTYAADAGPVHALTPTDLEVAPGEFVVLLGPSGCGKTTLLRMLAGLEVPTEGSVRMGDRTLFAPGAPAPQRDALGSLGFVFQAPTLMPWRRIGRNIELPLEGKGPRRRERRERAALMAEKVGLEDFLRHYPRQLSGGMQQRAAIARALVHDPDVLLMDEPFGALDAMTRDQMNILLQQLWMDTGKTVVLVTHSISEAVFLADRIVLLSPRPGRVKDVVEIDFPRPRPLSVSADPEFGEIVARLRAQLGEHE